jgi:two-component system, OmpR family, response regulator
VGELRASGTDEHPSTDAIAAPRDGTSLSVIVVDDDPDYVELLSDLITSYGHRVRSAERGDRALELATEEVPDLVFLDMSLPDIDGNAVAATMRARFGDRCWIVALTGYSGKEARDAAHRAGCDAFLVKPFRPEQIEELLDVRCASSSRPASAQPT